MRKTVIFILINLFIGLTFGQETINIDTKETLDSKLPLMQGFLHGNPKNLDSIKVALLKPSFWRIGAYALAGSSYEDAQRFNPKITININDYYMILNQITSQTLSKPWLNNWENWDSTVRLLALNSKNNNSTVDYWDVWGEPDNFWTGTYTQWIEMYRRTDSLLKKFIPNSKMTGPEFGFANCNFNVIPILTFLDSLKKAGTSVSGVSWHEFCHPEDVYLHVQILRDSLKKRQDLGPLEILIPEYAGPNNSTIPGWNVGWLYFFEKSKVNWVSHACWDEKDGSNTTWSNCEYGLNGLFMKDNKTPQPNYWTHRYYAELGIKRVETLTNSKKVAALCGIDTIKKEFNVLVGRFDNPNLGQHNAVGDVQIKIKNYPFCSNCSIPVMVKRIPSNNEPYSKPLLHSQDSFFGFAEVRNDSFTFKIKDFIDGDAMMISFNSYKDSLIKNIKSFKSHNLISIAPNPCQNFINLKILNEKELEIEIFDIYGRFYKNLTIQESINIDISELKQGIYFIKTKNRGYKTYQFIKL